MIAILAAPVLLVLFGIFDFGYPCGFNRAEKLTLDAIRGRTNGGRRPVPASAVSRSSR